MVNKPWRLRGRGNAGNRALPGGYSTRVVQQPSKLNIRVRVPLPAPDLTRQILHGPALRQHGVWRRRPAEIFVTCDGPAPGPSGWRPWGGHAPWRRFGHGWCAWPQVPPRAAARRAGAATATCAAPPSPRNLMSATIAGPTANGECGAPKGVRGFFAPGGSLPRRFLAWRGRACAITGAARVNGRAAMPLHQRTRIMQ